MKLRTLVAAGFAVAVASSLAIAAGTWSTLPIGNGNSYCASTVSGVNFPTAQGPYGVVPGSTQGSGSQGTCAQTVPAGPPLTGNEYVPADTVTPGSSSSSGAAGTVIIPSSALAGMTYGTPRNLLGNGALNITNSNGTSTVTCAANATPTIAAISADRWVCQANVGSGAGRTAIVTSSPSPPTGFTNVMKVWRNSGALTQPVCVWQAIPGTVATQLAGTTVTFSAYVAALAGLAADNGGYANMVVITGTGADEGLAVAPTTSPAITPAWTGIATAVNTQITLSTTFARFNTQAAIPAAATEVAVGLCFTPTATGAGVTDGFAFTGAQLERSNVPSLFEVRQKADENVDALKYFYKISEGAVGSVRAAGMNSTTSLAEGLLQFPVAMYKTPTMSYTAGFAACSTTACSANTACTAIRTSTLQSFAADTTRVMLECTSTAGFGAAGTGTFILDNGGSGVINAWTGF